MTKRRKISEGDPIAPVAQLVSAGLHERDVYIAAALCSAPTFATDVEGRFIFTTDAICDRVLAIADRMMDRKETP
jgi:hypothetical protein